MVQKHDGKNILDKEENVHGSLIGSFVDYFTRFLIIGNKKDAFHIPLRGAESCALNKIDPNAVEKSQTLLKNIQNLDEKSVINGLKLVGFDVCYRTDGLRYKPIEEINPNQQTINNILIMVERSLSFWNDYGPITTNGFRFKGGYTNMISSGDGDFLTKDTLWEFKVLRSELKSQHTLQLLVYYLMGIHSIYSEFQSISKIGAFNPRKNKVYILDLDEIPLTVIDAVSEKVIGYEKADTNFFLRLLRNPIPIIEKDVKRRMELISKRANLISKFEEKRNAEIEEKW